MFVIYLVASIILLAVLYEVFYIKFNGRAIPRPDISRQIEVLGQGQPLTFIVLGDSTAVSQGGDYSQGYAVATAHYLARKYKVKWQNLAEPGARSIDVSEAQIKHASPLKPDIVLVAVGANDVTHLTSTKKVYGALQSSIDALRRANPDVKIILTGAPDMGSIPRLPQPLRSLAGIRTRQLNAVVQRLVADNQVTFAPIAARTGSIFRTHPELFAGDNFHPTTEGYIVWIPVIQLAVDETFNHAT